MKLGVVIQRYGPGVVGGSEAHCRAMVERLAAKHDVTVLTSCARSHITWRNEFDPGSTRVGPVRVRRFRAVRQRRIKRFAELSELVFSGDGTAEEEELWFRENGPETPELLDHLETGGSEYDRVLFWSYRYYPSFFGVPRVADRAVLVPTAEEDAAIHLRSVRTFFTLPRSYLFLTPEEAELVAAQAASALPVSAIVGSGLEPALGARGAVDFQGSKVGESFALYLGRVDPNKRCQTLLQHFLRYLDATPRNTQLVLAGEAFMDVPEHPRITHLGYVNDRQRTALLQNAKVLLMPSRNESLSLVLLEAWNHGLPVLVNGRCKVTRGQTLRANGGLYYESASEFAAGLDLLVSDQKISTQLGQQGLAYVNEHYRWPTVMAKVEDLLSR